MISTARNALVYLRPPPDAKAKQGTHVAGLMTSVMKLGKMANTIGCCPVCGNDVALQHSFNGLRLKESYGCYRCGPTTYVVAVA